MGLPLLPVCIAAEKSPIAIRSFTNAGAEKISRARTKRV
jgi:hypothetical protein